MRRAGGQRHAALGLAVSLAIAGCNLVFGVGDPTLVDEATGGQAATTLAATGGGGQDQGAGGGGSCVGVVCDDGNICTSDYCDATFECAAAPKDDAVPEQLPGDCVRRVCSGGVLTLDDDDTDLPSDDQNPCTAQTCSAGMPTFAFEGTSVMCNGSGTCDGAGLCSTCVTASQCGINTECAAYSCNGQCGVVYADPATDIMQFKFDCKQSQCTGASAVPEVVPLDTDLEDDGNDCTIDKCLDGAPTHDAEPSGKQCSTGVCNGEGLCVACVDPSQCLGNPFGEACLQATWQCGCQARVDCRASKYGSACLPTEVCGCETDEDCLLPGAGGKFCNPEQKKCFPFMIEPL